MHDHNRLRETEHKKTQDLSQEISDMLTNLVDEAPFMKSTGVSVPDSMTKKRSLKKTKVKVLTRNSHI